MGPKTLRANSSRAWALAKKQHRVIARRQLLELGFNSDAIKHRISSGRLHPVQRGVYAVGARELSQNGLFMAAVLSCGPGATLSHDSAAALWHLLPVRNPIPVSIPGNARRRRPGIVVHPRRLGAGDVTSRHGIPVTTPVCTLVDIAARHPARRVERAINTADDLGLTDPERLRRALEHVEPRRPGAVPLRKLLDRRTLRMTRSELERRFLPIVRSAGLPMPLTKQHVNGFEVDFYWPDLGLVVETDSLRYHRTPQQQAKDRRRDQVHAAAGLECLRFTHDQIAHEPEYVRRILTAVARRLSQSHGIPVTHS